MDEWTHTFAFILFIILGSVKRFYSFFFLLISWKFTRHFEFNFGGFDFRSNKCYPQGGGLLKSRALLMFTQTLFIMSLFFPHTVPQMVLNLNVFYAGGRLEVDVL